MIFNHSFKNINIKINQIINFTTLISLLTPILLITFWVLNKDYNFYPDWHRKYLSFFNTIDFLNLYFFDKEIIYCSNSSIQFLEKCHNFLLVSKLTRLFYTISTYIIFLFLFVYLLFFYLNTHKISNSSEEYLKYMISGVFLSLTFPSLFYFLTDSSNEVIVYYLFFLSMIFYRTYIFFLLCFLSFLIDDNNTKIIILFYIFERFMFFINIKTSNKVYFVTLCTILVFSFLHSTTIIHLIDSFYSDKKITAIMAGFVLLNKDLPLIGRIIYFFVSLLYYDPIQHTFNIYFYISIFLIIIAILIINFKKMFNQFRLYLFKNTNDKNQLITSDNFMLHLLIISVFFTIILICLLPTHAFAKYYLYIYPIFFAFLSTIYDKKKILMINLLLTTIFITTF